MLTSTRIVATAFLAFATLVSAQTTKPTFKKIASWDLQATGSFDYLTLSPTDHRLYITQDHQVIVIDTVTGKVLANIAGLSHVHGIALSADGKIGYISDGLANKIFIFDCSTLKLTGVIPTEGLNPDALVIDPASGHLFTFNGKSKEGVAIDLGAAKVIAHFAVSGKPEFPQADGKGSVFVNVETTSQLLRIDTATNKVVATWKLTGCDGPSGLDIDRTNHRLFSVCDGEMAVTDSTTGKQVALVPIGDGPDAVWYDGGRHLIFASNGGTGTLSIILQNTPDNYTVVQTIPTSKGARTMTYDGTTGTAYVISLKTSKGEANSDPKHLFLDVFAQR